MPSGIRVFALLALSATLAACGGAGGHDDPGRVALATPSLVQLGLQPLGVRVDTTIELSSTLDAPATLTPTPPPAPFGWKGGAFPGQGGTCDLTLAAGASCTLVVSWTPSAPGAASAIVAIEWRSGLATGSLNVTIGGSGAQPAHLTASPAAGLAFGTVAVGASPALTLTVQNDGGSPATGLGATPPAPFAWASGGFPGGGTCAATLDAGASCTMMVKYTPTDAVVSAKTLQLAHQTGAGAAALDVDLAGTGAARAALTASPSAAWDFGDVVTSAPALTHRITLKNEGGVSATQLGAVAAPPSAFDWAGGTFPGTAPGAAAAGPCGDTLAPGASCEVVVAFEPLAAGPAADALAIAFQDGVGAASLDLDLAGNAAAAAFLAFSGGPTHDFGTHVTDSTTEHVFTVTNLGGLTATALTPSALPAPFRWKGAAYPGTGGTCGATLTGLASCTVVVEFHPTAAGAASATLSIGYHDGAVTQAAQRPLAGAGTTAAYIALTDAPAYHFGELAFGATADRTFTATNTGGVAATGFALAALPAGFSVVATTCPTPGNPLAAGASCTVTVRFAPQPAGTEASRYFAGLVALSPYGNDPSTGQQVALSGTGTAGPALRFDEGTSHDFGAVAVGASPTFTVTLRNTGAASATGLTVGALAAPLSRTTTCGATLAAGATCSVTVTYAPTVAGNAAASLTATAAGAEAAPLALTGTAVPPALLALAEGTAVDFGAPVVGATASRTVTVRNRGSLPATAVSAAAPAAPFRFAGIAGTFPGTGGTCAATIAPGDACDVVVEFAPAQATAASATLSIGYQSGAGAASLPVPLGGTGTAPARLEFADAPAYAFADTVAGATRARTLVVRNTGGATATSLARTGPASPFSVAGSTCGATLAAAAECAVPVTFAPDAAGSFAGSVALEYQDGATAASASLPLSGKALAPASVTLSGAQAWVDTVAGTVAPSTITVTHGGEVPATGLAADFSGAWRWAGNGAFPGAGGTCTGTLAIGASCTLGVEFAPAVAGAATGAVTVSWHDGVGARSKARDVSGKALLPAALAFEPAAVDFGIVALGETATRIVTVTNGGEWPAALQATTGLGGAFAYAGAFPGLGGTCEASVAPGQSCRIVVAFTPAATGAASADLSLGYGNGAAATSAHLALSGAGTEDASIQVTDWPVAYYESYGLPPDAATFDFGEIGAGKAVGHEFYLTNTGKAAAQLDGLTGLSGPLAFAGSTCGATLAPGASCTVIVTFSPPGEAAVTQTFTVQYSDAAGAKIATRAVTGAGTLGPAVVVHDFEGGVLLGPAWDFGARGPGVPAEKEFYVTNEGATAALELGAAAFPAGFGFKGGGFPGAGGSCLAGAALAPGETCVVVVEFKPVAAGPAQADLTIQWKDGTVRSAKRALRGAGITTALVYVQTNAPAVLDLGVVGVGQPPRTIELEVQNVGGAAATGVATTALDAPFSYVPPKGGAACGATLAPGASCAIGVKFAPAAPGKATALPGVTYSDGAQPRTATHALEGTGTLAAFLSVHDWSDEEGFDVRVTPFDFGVTGQPVSHTFTVRNDGAADATSLAVAALDLPFSLTTSCGAVLAPGATCTVTATFTPSGDGAAGATISVGYDGGVATRALDARSTSAALLAITDCPECDLNNRERAIDFGTSGVPTDRYLYVINLGAAAAESMGGTVDGAAFGFAGGYPGAEDGKGGGASPCGTTLAAGQACRIGLRFTPTGAGPLAGRVTMTWDGGAAHRGLTGTAVNTALLQIRDWPDYAPDYRSPYDFGVAGSPVAKVFTVLNAGPLAATLGTKSLSAGFVFTGGAFPGTNGDCGATLAAGAACEVEVAFQPSGSSTATGTLGIAYGDGAGGTATATRGLTGTGTDRASVWLLDWRDQTPSSYVPPPYDFGEVGQPSSRTVYVLNSGAKTANLTPVVSGQGYALGAVPDQEWEPPACGATLAVGARCRLVVQFTPPAEEARFDGTLTVSYSDSIGALGPVARQFTGLATLKPMLTLMDGPWGSPDGAYDFGTTGVAKGAAFILANMGGGDALLGIPTITSADSSYAFGDDGAFPGAGQVPMDYPPLCGATIPKGQSCTFLVVFSPSGAPPLVPTEGVVDVPYGPAGEAPTRNVTRKLIATATDRALLGVSEYMGAPPACEATGDCSWYLGGATVGVVQQATLHVTNVGALPGSITGGSTTGPFQYAGGGLPAAPGAPVNGEYPCYVGMTLNVGNNCFLTIELLATEPGEVSGEAKLTFTDSMGGTLTSGRHLSATAN